MICFPFRRQFPLVIFLRGFQNIIADGFVLFPVLITAGPEMERALAPRLKGDFQLSFAVGNEILRNVSFGEPDVIISLPLLLI